MAPAAAPATGSGAEGGAGPGTAPGAFPADPRSGGWGWGEGSSGPPVLGGVAAGTLPQFGISGFPTDIGGQAPLPPGRTYTLTPSIAADVTATDNSQLSQRNRRSDIVTTITPAIDLRVDTARVQGLLSYAPGLQYFGRDQDTRILQRGNAQFLASIVPDALFLDVRANASTQTARGGFSPQAAGTVNNSGLVQTTSFQVSPYYVHRFGDTATAQVGYTLQAVQQNLGDGAGVATTPDGQVFFRNNDFISHSAYAVARTGPDFGPLALEGRAAATEYDGTGVLENAYVRRTSIASRYAITQHVALLGEVGYEWQRYSGTTPFNLSEPTWGVGARFLLAEDSSVTVRYIRSGGFDSPAVEASVALGGRTRLFANYSEVLTTGAQRAADLLSTTTLDALGNPVDARSGAPVVPSAGDSFQGAQSGLQRIRRGAITLSQSWPRDILSLTAANERRRSVTVAPGTIAIDQESTTLTFSWSRALTPATSVIGALTYGRLESATFGKSETYLGSATLSNQFSPGLAGYIQYALTNRTDESFSGNAVQNLVRVGLRQSF